MAEAFRKYSTARKKAEGTPVIRVDDLYITERARHARHADVS